MTNKIIIVGPSGAGKTTLRKIFFEGENALYILKFALEPTHGQETIILKLKEEIGIFDLAGQENKRWFETDDKVIFSNTRIILVVIDITTQIIVAIKFIKKIIEIRKELTPHSQICVLMHKIDLINQKELNEIKSKINDALSEEKLISVYFTSVQKEYFITTFSIFIEILNICIQNEKSSEKFAFDLLNETIRFLHQIDKELTASTSDIQLKLNITGENLNIIIDNLVQKGQIQFTPINDENVFTLTEKGKNNFNKILNNFSLKSILEVKDEVKITDFRKPFKIPPFVGYFVADKDSLTLFTIELFDGALLKFMKDKTETPIEDDKFDINLIPMFISALEKFLKEINIQNLSGFTLRGINLKMQIFAFDDYTVTFFMNPNINIKLIDYEIKKYFNNLFETYNDKFRNSLQQGSLEFLDNFNYLGRKWLEELYNSYKNTIMDLDSFDIESANNLYNSLNDFQEEIGSELSTLIGKIKSVKFKLLNAILEENFEVIKELAKYA